MKILVTGGAGFIGQHICRILHQQKQSVRVLDNFSTGSKAALASLPIEILTGDILDPMALTKAVSGMDAVIHLAAMVSVPESLIEPEHCYRVNVKGTEEVAAAAAAAGVQRFLFASSCAVYGDDPAQPKREDSPLSPLSPYAESKLRGESIICAKQKAGSFSPCALRFFNVYGEGQSPSSPYSGVVSKFIALAKQNKPLTIFGDGEASRDFVYVQDVAKACAHFLSKPHLEGIFQVASGEETPIRTLGNLIIELTHSDSSMEYAPARKGDVQRSSADIAKMLSTGLEKPRSLKAGLSDCLPQI